jgi:hypothetical protein
MNIYDLLRYLANHVIDPNDKVMLGDANRLIDNLETVNAFGTVASEGSKHVCDYQPKQINISGQTYSPYRGYSYVKPEYETRYKCIYCGRDRDVIG